MYNSYSECQRLARRRGGGASKSLGRQAAISQLEQQHLRSPTPCLLHVRAITVKRASHLFPLALLSGAAVLAGRA
jgi:hypothetical protein